jgi:hypothetical protein
MVEHHGVVSIFHFNLTLHYVQHAGTARSALLLQETISHYYPENSPSRGFKYLGYSHPEPM